MQHEQLQEGTLDRLSQSIARRLSRLNTLANCLRDMFRRDSSRPELLERPIDALRLGLSMHPPGADRYDYMNDLPGALWERYRAQTLNNLAICLRDRYKEQRSSSDLNQAIKTHEAALSLRPEGHPDRSFSLTNLALCLRDRFEEKSSTDDLIAYSRDALALRQEGHPLRPSCLSNLAIALQYQYELHGTLGVLQESIQLLRAALAWYPPDHSERATVQFNLCLSLGNKFRRDGTISDLDEAIDLLRPLKERGSLRHPIYPFYIDSLANCLKERFRHLGAPAGFEEAIMLHAIAVEICPRKPL